MWLKQAYTTPPSDFHTLRSRMAGDLGRIVRILKQRFPNLQFTYLSTRIYGHYSSNLNREEPSAYDAAYAARTLIQQQINGHPAVNFDPRRGPMNAPWLAWGPYLWNDGLNPRSDGFVWECADLEDDGHHPAESADRKVSDMLMEFFRTDATTQGWFLAD